MATTKTTTPRKRTAKTSGTRTVSRAATPRAATTEARSNSEKDDDTLVARTGRTLKDRPYTSAAIATGAVTLAAAVGAAGAFLYARRDKSFKEASGELTDKVKGGFASASETIKDGLASATDRVKDLGERGTGLFKNEDSDTGTGTETRTQQQIAEEALTLKQTGEAKSPIDALSATEIKTGAVAY